MSELKPITVTDECGSYSVYSKSDVDAVIAEKDMALEYAKALTLKDIETIKEKDKEIAELKEQLESEKASRYAESVDAGMRERRLKRALWLARAKRAEARKNYWYVRSIHEGDKDLWSIDGSAVKYIGCIKRTNFDWLKIWSEVESKCRAKAKEYK
jgi:hypothetical protein